MLIRRIFSFIQFTGKGLILIIKAAVKIFKSCVIETYWSDETYILNDDEKISDLIDFPEFYVVFHDSKWTYINTHETNYRNDPYFKIIYYLQTFIELSSL